ncbi:MAG: hypothetical protein O0X49_01650 [Methanocorpusculum sp.]|nr:hypothetical protein [Methanocorpusculum sp.]
MGAWTANYQLYLAAAGEQGWGDLVNGNFETIDTKLKESMDATTAAAKTAEWANISGKPSTYPSSWSQISGKPNVLTSLSYKGIPLVSESTRSVNFNASGNLAYDSSVVLATVNGYVLNSPLSLQVRITGGNNQTPVVVLSAGGESVTASLPLSTNVVTLTVPTGRKITQIELSRRTGPSPTPTSYTCLNGSISVSDLSFTF